MNDKFVDMPKCMVDKYETADFIASDPVQFPRRYSGRDAEVSGFIASWLSFGNRKVIIGAAIGAHDAGCSRKDKGVVSVMVQGGGGISRKA